MTTIDFDLDDDAIDPRLRACIREMRLAETPLAALQSIKRELAKIAPSVLDKQAIVDALLPYAEEIGLDKQVGQAIEYAIAHALSAHARGNGSAGRNGEAHNEETGELGEWDAGDDEELWGHIPPREWLLGNVFCRCFLSSLLAGGGTGKTALRIAQLISLAIGRSLTGEHVFQRCRVLIVSLEDNARELRRRILAACIHHNVSREELKGWLFIVTLKSRDGKLMVLDNARRPTRGTLVGKLEKTVIARRIDIISLDPFVKAHRVEENLNTSIDEVVEILSDLCETYNLSIDTPHHISKGAPDPGNADRGRGASAMKDAGRLVYTLTPMSPEEAQAFGLTEAERVRMIRMDSGKVNIAPRAADAKWFRLVGVPLGNRTERYPSGDEAQTVEPWHPPDIWRDLSIETINLILDDVEAGVPNGQQYSVAAAAKSRAVWQVVVKHCPTKTEVQARQVVKKWIKSGLLIEETYRDETERKELKGLRVENSKRPGGAL